MQLILTVNQEATADPLQVVTWAPGQFWSPAVPADLISCEPVAVSLHSCRSPPEMPSCKEEMQIQVLFCPPPLFGQSRPGIWPGCKPQLKDVSEAADQISCEPVVSCSSSIIASPAKGRHTGTLFFGSDLKSRALFCLYIGSLGPTITPSQPCIL